MAQIQLKGKLLIRAVLTVKTGLHIGESSDFAPIGGVDSPFIRDPLTKNPIIPGSSLKGKMRTLLAKVRDGRIELPDPSADEPVVARLFGVAPTDGNKDIKPARLQFFDVFVKSETVQKFKNLDTDTYLGEIKAENTINRATGIANPRMIERVPAGMTFDFQLVYNIETEDELEEDLQVLIRGFRLLQLDYIGGHGSRGYGRIEFSNFNVKKMDPETAELLEEATLTEKFKGTEL